MISITSLWLPILLSGVIVFIVSSILNSVLTYHRSDYSKIPKEDDVADALRKFEIPPGDYVMPYASSNQERGSAEFKEKMEKGPLVFFTVLPKGQTGMAKSLILWFLYCILIGIFVAYLCSRMLDSGTDYLAVFRYSGTIAFAGYSLALLQNSIWFSRSWSATLKFVFDGLIYALLTAGTFGWLWPN